LSARQGRPITLATVLAETWDAIAAAGFDSVWLMGVWHAALPESASPRGMPGCRPDHQSYLNLIAWGWRTGGERYVIIINLSSASAQGLVQLPWTDLSEGGWLLTDLFTGEVSQ
jgi:hypothetical protein